MKVPVFPICMHCMGRNQGTILKLKLSRQGLSPELLQGQAYDYQEKPIVPAFCLLCH